MRLSPPTLLMALVLLALPGLAQAAEDAGGRTPAFKEGDILGNILDAVESESASLVMMGSNEENMFGRLTRSSISQELLRHTSVPTTVLPIQAIMRRKEEMKLEKKREEESFSDDKVDFTSLNALEKMEEESMDFDEE